MKDYSTRFLMLLVCLMYFHGYSQSKNTQQPNVIFILADDLGWRDVGYMGSVYYQTPHIDALANSGMIFKNAYSASPLCSASRSAIITGRYPSKTGIIDASCHLKEVRLAAEVRPKSPPFAKALSVISATRLNLDFYTLGEAFKDAGYATAHIGKWHLGAEPFDPLHQGFDIDIPHTNSSGPNPNGWFAPWPVWPGHGKVGDNLEDAMTDEVVNYIKSHKDKPFLLDYWSFSVHGPWDAKKNLIDKYAILANPNDPQHNPVYAGMVETFDNGVGRIMQTLKEEGLLGNTIIVFCSDNGGVNWAEGANIPDPYKQVPITSNLPLRAGKATDYNGGVHVPLAVIWPGHTKAGSSNNTPVSGVDIYPTLLDMCGIKQKTGVDYDGKSFVPALQNKEFKRGPIFFHFPTYIKLTNQVPATAVIDGDFKLIRDYCDNDDQTDRFELYNLKDDISEKNDLADKMPQKVQELNKLITKFLTQSNTVIPKPNPNYRVGAQPTNNLPANYMPN